MLIVNKKSSQRLGLHKNMTENFNNMFKELQRTGDAVLKSSKGKGTVVDWVKFFCSHPDAPKLSASFLGREFLIDVLNDLHPEIDISKGSQGGFTVAHVWKAFCVSLMRQELGPTSSIIYTLPRLSDLQQFHKTRFKKIAGGCSVLKMLDDQRKDSVKQSSYAVPIGDSFLLFMAAISDRNAVSTPASGCIHDELDKSDPAVIAQYVSRLGAELNPFIWRFSNPTLIGDGIDGLYEFTDKRKWNIKCPHCGHWQTQDWEPEGRWEKNHNPFIIVPKNGDDAYYACQSKECGKRIDWSEDIKQEWVAEFDGPRVIDGKKFNRHGYHWSQINAWGWKPAQRIIDDFNRYVLDFEDSGEQAGERLAYNMILGKGYESNVKRLDKKEIRNCQVPGIKWRDQYYGKELVLGADQGKNENYYMIAEPITVDGKQKLRVVHLEISKEPMFDYKDEFGTSQQGRLTQLREIYRPTIGILDAQPNEENSLYECLRAGGMLWRVYYNYQQMIPINFQEPKYDDIKCDFQVKVNKTMVLDKVVRGIRNEEWEFPPLDELPGNLGEKFIENMTTPKRKEKLVRGKLSEIWEGKPDHFFNVSLYLKVAVVGLGFNAPKRVFPIRMGGV